MAKKKQAPKKKPVSRLKTSRIVKKSSRREYGAEIVKVKSKTGKTYSKSKRLYAPSGKYFEVYQSKVRFKKSISVSAGSKNKRRVGEAFDAYIKPKLEDFVRRNRKRGDEFILSVKLGHNVINKRLKGGFSKTRQRIRTERGLKRAMEEYKKDFMKSLAKYLSRKDMTSMTFQGVKMEVTKDVKKSLKKKRVRSIKTAQPKPRKKKKTT